MALTKKRMAKGEVTKKKITFFSAILLVIGSSIGAGIFLKNREILQNVGNSVVLAIISWIFSIVGVICMGISLAEIGSNNESSNLGVIQWVKKFNSKYLFKVCKYFMAFIYLPFNFFVMPYYAVMTLQDAFGWQTQWWVAALIAFAIMVYFFISAGLSSRAADIQNKIVLSVKFIPLVFCALAGIILACCGKCYVDQPSYPTWVPTSWGMDPGTTSLANLFPVLGIFGSIPAIIFSFDGFYASAGIQSEMQEPRKTPLALIIGLLVVSALDILISISLLVGSQHGSVATLNFFKDGKWHIVIVLLEVMIAFGILGIVNGFAVYNPRYYEDLIKDYQLPFSGKLKDKINPNKPLVGLLYAGVLTLFFFIVLTLIGALAYSDTGKYLANAPMIPIWGGEPTVWGYDANNVKTGLNSLYSFCDLMANWTSLLVFACIVFATIGCLKNRKTNKIEVVKVKGFVPCSIISITLISLAIIFVLASTFGNIGLAYMRGDSDDKLGAIMTLVVLILFVLICCIPSAIEAKKEKGKPETYRPWLA